MTVLTPRLQVESNLAIRLARGECLGSRKTLTRLESSFRREPTASLCWRHRRSMTKCFWCSRHEDVSAVLSFVTVSLVGCLVPRLGLIGDSSCSSIDGQMDIFLVQHFVALSGTSPFASNRAMTDWSKSAKWTQQQSEREETRRCHGAYRPSMNPKIHRATTRNVGGFMLDRRIGGPPICSPTYGSLMCQMRRLVSPAGDR